MPPENGRGRRDVLGTDFFRSDAHGEGRGLHDPSVGVCVAVRRRRNSADFLFQTMSYAGDYFTVKSMCHFDEQGASRMVDVGAKTVSARRARASAVVRMQPATLTRVQERDTAKGDVLEVARLAGIMASKRTADLIPLCHPLPLDAVTVDFTFPDATSVRIEVEARVAAKTGVEMEAMTAAAVTALTIYDMCKGMDRSMSIELIQLEEKEGGKSGHYRRESSASGST